MHPLDTPQTSVAPDSAPAASYSISVDTTGPQPVADAIVDVESTSRAAGTLGTESESGHTIQTATAKLYRSSISNLKV